MTVVYARRPSADQARAPLSCATRTGSLPSGFAVVSPAVPQYAIRVGPQVG